MNFKIKSHWCKWRPQERESFESIFGKVRMIDIETDLELLKSISKDSVCFLMPSNPQCDKKYYKFLLDNLSNIKTSRIINKIEFQKNAFDKTETFKIWKKNNVLCPKYFNFIDEKEFYINFKNSNFSYPILLRVTNESSGKGSMLVESKNDINEKLKWIFDYNKHKSLSSGLSSLMCVEFLDTKKITKTNINFSYRVIVAGGKIVTGYSRISLGDNWNAITTHMNMPFNEISHIFIKFNLMLQDRFRDKEWVKKVEKAANVTGLDAVSLDIIEDDNNNPVFIEVNHTWAAGYLSSDSPPFYNPCNKEIVDFLLKNAGWFEKNLPTYWYYWLNKRLHFDEVFKNCKDKMIKDKRW